MMKYKKLFIYLIIASIIIYIYYCKIIFEEIGFNDAKAVGAIRGYIYIQKKYFNAYGTYIDNYRNLYYGGLEKKSKIDKIIINKSMASKSFADAFVIDNALDKSFTIGEHQKSATAFNGFFFQEDIFGTLSTDISANKTAFIAFPAEYGKTGSTVFWIDINGKVKYHTPNVRTGTKAIELIGHYIYNTPLNKKCQYKWEDLDKSLSE